MLGRATIMLLISQVFLVASGYTITVGLARLLGPKDFGTFGVVISLLAVVEMFVITGIPIALRKYVAENYNTSKLLMWKTLPWHLLYSLIIFLLFWLLAPVTARLFKDHFLKYFLQLASLDIVFFGLYKYFVGIQNGLHKFGRQAVTDISYAIAKPVAILGLVLAGYSISGAVVGNVIGSIVGLLIGLLIIRFPEVKGGLENIPFLKFAFINVFYSVGIQLLFSIDLWFVKYYLSYDKVGQYVSASSVSKIPFFFSLAISAVLLPSISRATKAKNDNRVQDIVRLSLRYLLVILFAMIVVVSPSTRGLILFLFGENYADASSILAILFVATTFISFFAVINTILIARNQLKRCLVATGLLIVLYVVTNALLVPKLGCIGAAISTLIISIIGVGISSLLLLKNLQVVISPHSVLRSIAAALAAVSIVYLFPLFDQHVILKCMVLLGSFVTALFLLRELSFADMKRFQAILNPGSQLSV